MQRRGSRLGGCPRVVRNRRSGMRRCWQRCRSDGRVGLGDRRRHITGRRVGWCRARRGRLSYRRLQWRWLRCRGGRGRSWCKRRLGRRSRRGNGDRSRSRRRHRSGSRRRGRLGSRRRPWREERQRVEVSLVVRRRPNSEMDIGLGELGISGGPNGADNLPIRHGRSARDHRGAKMRECHGVAVARHHRDDQAALRDSADEAHSARGRSAHVLARSSADVNAAMPTTRVRAGRPKVERTEHRATRGPRPRVGSRGNRKGDQHQGTNNRPPHQATLLRCTGIVVFFGNVKKVKSSERLGCRQL